MLTAIPDGVVCYLDATIFYYHLVDAPPLSDDCSDLLTRIAQRSCAGRHLVRGHCGSDP